MTVYPQFCALARALEMLGERWTLLIVRELLLGPKRFSDLRDRLDGISSSVLSQRLSRLEVDGIVRRSYLEPPAASTVFELTPRGRALEQPIFELIRWGSGLLYPPRPGERREPGWMGLVLRAYARTGRVPRRSFEMRLKEGDAEATFHVKGTARGTLVGAGLNGCDTRFTTDFETALGLMSGQILAAEALAKGLLEAQGDVSALAHFPELFDVKGVMPM